VEAIRVGGMNKDGKTVTMFEGTSLPNIGGLYVFYCNAQPDGRIVLMGEDVHAEIDVKIDKGADDIEEIKSRIKSSKKYHAVLEALENEIVYNRPRDVAKDDISSVEANDIK